jgi:hypothetical protein
MSMRALLLFVALANASAEMSNDFGNFEMDELMREFDQRQLASSMSMVPNPAPTTGTSPTSSTTDPGTVPATPVSVPVAAPVSAPLEVPTEGTTEPAPAPVSAPVEAPTATAPAPVSAPVDAPTEPAPAPASVPVEAPTEPAPAPASAPTDSNSIAGTGSGDVTPAEQAAPAALGEPDKGDPPQSTVLSSGSSVNMAAVAGATVGAVAAISGAGFLIYKRRQDPFAGAFSNDNNV